MHQFLGIFKYNPDVRRNNILRRVQSELFYLFFSFLTTENLSVKERDNNNNSVHFSCAHQRPERSHD